MASTEKSFSHAVKTLKTINPAVDDITTSLKDVGFGILGTLDFKEILQKKRLDFKDECGLLEVCNPDATKQVLESNQEIVIRESEIMDPLVSKSLGMTNEDLYYVLSSIKSLLVYDIRTKGQFESGPVEGFIHYHQTFCKGHNSYINKL
ncbi:MAG: DUF302 domain-containing protein [Nitrosotalea sp.]